MKKQIVLIIILLLLGNIYTYGQTEEDVNYLSELSLEELMNVNVVTASKSEEKISDAPGIITTITSKEIEQFGAINFTELLDRVVGSLNLSSTLNIQNIVSMRGDVSNDFDSHILLLINSRPFREGLFGGVNSPLYLSLPLSMIDRIEVVRGPGSVLYGSNAYSGVVNIITKKASESGGEFEGMAGSFAGKGVSGHYSFKKEDLNIMAGIKYFDEEGWDFEATDIAGVTNEIKFGEQNLGGNLMIDYKGLSLNTVLASSEQNFFSSRPLWRSPVPQTEGSILNFFRALVDVGYQHDFSKKFSSGINVTYNGFTGGEKIDIDYKANDWLVELSNYFDPADHINIVVGGTYYNQNGRFIQNDLVFIPDYTKIWYSGYAQMSYKPVKSLNLIAGAQINKVEGVDANFAPRLGIIYQVTDKLGVKALYGEAFRAPFAVETSVIVSGFRGNPDLKPETLTSIDAQVFFRDKGLELSATYFTNRKEDNITRNVTEAGEIVYMNANEIKSSGIEFEGKYILNKRWFLTGSYAWQQNEIDFFGTNIEDFSLLPNHIVKLGVNYQHPRGVSIGLFNTTVSAFGDLTEISGLPQRNEIPEGFSLLSGKLNMDLNQLFDLALKQKLILGVYGSNLLDADVYYPDITNRLINSFPGRSGRAVYGSVTVRF